MSEFIEKICQPPIGFIVEGDGEYYCYPSLVCRILRKRGFDIPIVNAGGCGSLVKRLDDHLDSLVLSKHPYNIIVTLDLKDMLSEHFYSDCKQLIFNLDQKIKNWSDKSVENPRLDPLPNQVLIVIQIQTFESWLISDISNLNKSGYVTVPEKQFTDVDYEVSNPFAWLRPYLDPGTSLKNPKHAKAMISHLDPNVMRRNSRSFDKLFRETTLCYDRWYRECTIANTE